MNLFDQRADLVKGKNITDSQKQIEKLSQEIKTSIRKDTTQRRM